jgi:hypothetical protein
MLALSPLVPPPRQLVVQPRAHTHPCEGRRRCARNRAAEPSSSPGALPLLRLCRRSFLLSPSWLSHRHSPAPTQPSPCTPRVKPKHPDHDHLVALFHLTSEDVLPTVWVHGRQAKLVQVFVHTHARRRTPRRAAAELTAVAKPPACLHAQVRTWALSLADQYSLTHVRAKASPFCGQTSCELKPSPPTFSPSPGKPRS